MRNIAIFIFSIVSLVACNSSSQFTLDCTITNATQGEMVCLTYPVKHDGVWCKQCDTTYIKNGKFCFHDDMIMASEDIPLSMEDMSKYDDEDAAREEKKPTRIFREFCANDIELTSYEQLSLAYDNIKGAIENYIND